MAKTKGARKEGRRSETVSIRLDPKLRYLAELAARQQRRTLSSYIEWAVDKSLASVEIGPAKQTIADRALLLWDVEEADRFLNLSLQYEHLLSHREQVLWKLIRDNDFFWSFLPPQDGECQIQRTRIGADPVQVHGTLEVDKVREWWTRLIAVAEGRASQETLPSPESTRTPPLRRPTIRAPIK